MSHGLDSNLPCLRRWAAHQPEEPMPQDWSAFEKANPQAAMQVQMNDPELVSLLQNKAPAGLRADALSGKLSPCPPDPETRAKEAKISRVNEILAKKPFGDANTQGNISLCMELALLDPALFAKMEAEARGPEPTAEEKQYQAQMAAEADRRARHESVLRGQAISKLSRGRF